jgi:hypothetical protein
LTEITVLLPASGQPYDRRGGVVGASRMLRSRIDSIKSAMLLMSKSKPTQLEKCVLCFARRPDMEYEFSMEEGSKEVRDEAARRAASHGPLARLVVVDYKVPRFFEKWHEALTSQHFANYCLHISCPSA